MVDRDLPRPTGKNRGNHPTYPVICMFCLGDYANLRTLKKKHDGY